MKDVCCIPKRPTASSQGARQIAGKPCSLDFVTVDVPGGTAFVGTESPHLKLDGEGAIKQGRVRPFRLTQTAITNAQFQAFIMATQYKTDAEKIGNSFVFFRFMPNDDPAPQMPAPQMPGAPWWRLVDGAQWDAPYGPGSTLHGLDHHPVVHVSWNDVRAFATWAGGRLPNEMEWEHAARAGQGDVPFPWGEQEPDDRSHFPCNIWQGQFPGHDTGADGFSGTAPVDAYAPNPWGLFNMVGNTWEWTADTFTPRTMSRDAKRLHQNAKGFKTIKGGSYLCHLSYCYRYRIAARSASSPDSSTGHQGFRLAFD